MSTRIHQSAQTLIDEKDLDPDQIEGTGSGGTIKKSDVQEYLEAGGGDLPSKEELIRRGLAQGMSNEEIGNLVHDTLGEDVPWDNGYLSWTIGTQRRNNTEW